MLFILNVLWLLVSHDLNRIKRVKVATILREFINVADLVGVSKSGVLSLTLSQIADKNILSELILLPFDLVRKVVNFLPLFWYKAHES